MELHTVTLCDTGKEIVTRPFTAHGVIVPAGFVFDGASAPRILWSIIPPYKRTKKAACIHDYLCSLAKDRDERKEADGIFYTMLREAGLNRFRCTLGYLGVRIGAWWGSGVRYDHWNNGEK